MEMPIEVKEYFKSGRRLAKKVIAQEDFTLRIEFDNGVVKTYDMKEALKGKVFAPIRNWDRFKEVHIDNSGCIAWNTDPYLDISTDSCYIYGH